MATVLITGASRGIGAAAARAFAAAGWDLQLVARTLADLEALAAPLRSQGCEVAIASADFSDPACIAPTLAGLLAEGGGAPAVVINNAGVAYTGALMGMPLADWQWLLQLNLSSVFQVCSVLVPAMRQAGGGRIINVSSHAARHVFADWGAYCTSKAALMAFSRCLAEEERAHGIQVSTLTLGAVDTPLWGTETVHASFDPRAMLSADQAAEALLYLAQQPPSQVVEDLTLMPATGVL